MAGGKLKIVVFGSYNAGKSTFIQAIDSQARHVEAHTSDGDTTVAIDYGRAEIHALQVYLFGTPGQERFEFVRQIVSRGMDAAILVVDCSIAPDEFTRSLYETLSRQKIPLAVMLNKCDLPGSCPATARSAFGDSLVFEICASERSRAMTALTAFVETLAGDL
ncbi:MAG: GTP-binding protein [Methanolinea sp.]|jgi:hypothetical protein|nr:GTP-binding protein [Methanolinea sp.]